jgi:hypothetical protein
MSLVLGLKRRLSINKPWWCSDKAAAFGHMARIRILLGANFLPLGIVSRGQHLRRRRLSRDATINDMGKIFRPINVIVLRVARHIAQRVATEV